MIIIIAVVGSILGYGYWHSSTHASFHVQLSFKNVPKGAPKIIPKAEISFLDSEGRVLAKGISDEEHNFVHLIHPESGDCHDAEKSASFSEGARESWQECFEHLSTWIPKWAREVRQVDIKTQSCLWRNIPVTVSESNPDWYLWWVPHPHVGGKPYSYSMASITVDRKNYGN
jgi:hypothetical protein